MYLLQDFCKDYFPSIWGPLQSLHTKRGHPERLGEHHLHSERHPAWSWRCRASSVQKHSQVGICRWSEEKGFVLNVSPQYKLSLSLWSKSSKNEWRLSIVKDSLCYVLHVCCISSLAWLKAFYLWWLLMLVMVVYFWVMVVTILTLIRTFPALTVIFYDSCWEMVKTMDIKQSKT